MELKKGDYYSVAEACQDGWLKGRCLKTGKAGVFPGNYVQPVRSPSAGNVPNSVQNVRAKSASSTSASSSSKSSSRQEKSASSRQESLGSVRPDNNAHTKQHAHTSRLEGFPSSKQELSTAFKSVPSSSSSSVSPGSQASSVQSSSSHRSHLPPSSIASQGAESNSDRSLITPKSSSPHASEHLPSTQSGNVHKPIHVKGSKASPRRSSSSEMQTLSSNTVVGPPNSVIGKSGPVMGAVSAPVSVVPNAQLPDAVGASGESSQPNKKEKREKEKMSLVKRLTSGKIKKSKSSPDNEGADKISHTRSGSYPSEVVNSVEGQHVKTGSFDSSMYPSHGSKHSKHKLPHREKYRCKEPYPAQHVIELDLSVGDIVYVTRKREDGWFKGTLQRSGKTGLFPGSFVEKLD